MALRKRLVDCELESCGKRVVAVKYTISLECGNPVMESRAFDMAVRAKKTMPVILTIGHSTRSLESFLNLLLRYGVNRIVDIRSIPKSRHNPQFNKETLPGALLNVGIAYEHIRELGGLRHPLKNSRNLGWRNASFRGFADYMQTSAFATGLQKLIDLAQKEQIAIMCAEAVPWRCHRSLIADALTIRHIQVKHILNEMHTQTHALTPWASVEDGRIVYLPTKSQITVDSE